SFFFFNDTATTEIYTLSLHDALPIWQIRKGTKNKKDGSSAALLQLRQHQLRQFLQRLEHALPRHRDALEHRLALTLQLFRQSRNRHRIRQVARVELQHIRN